MTATPKSTIEGATANLDTDLLALGGVGLAIGVTLFALRKGVKVVYGMIR